MPLAPTGQLFRARTWILFGLLATLVGAWFVLFADRWRVDWRLMAARRTLEAGQPGIAAEQIEQIDRQFPNRANVIYWLGVARRRSGDLSNAETLFNRARLLGAPADDLQLQKCLLSAQRGQFDTVEEQLRTFMERGVDDETAAEIYEAMAEGYTSAYRLRDAWRCLEFWAEWQPQAVKPRLLRGAICQRIGNSQQAVDEYRAALAADPTQATIHEKLGRTLLELNRVQDAQQVFQLAAERFEKTPEFQWGWASCDRRLGNADAARDRLKPLIDLELPPALRAEILIEAGVVELESSNYDTAIRYLEKAVELTPREPAVHHALARAFKLAGRGEEADKHLKLNQQLRAATQRLHDITKTLLDEPNRADLRYEAGVLVASQGFLDEAVGWWFSALKFDADHGPSHLALAKVFEAKGDQSRAALHRQRAAQAKPPASAATTKDNAPSRAPAAEGKPNVQPR